MGFNIAYNCQAVPRIRPVEFNARAYLACAVPHAEPDQVHGFLDFFVLPRSEKPLLKKAFRHSARLEQIAMTCQAFFKVRNGEGNRVNLKNHIHSAV